MTGATVEIPLLARNGSIRGYALIDAEDFPIVGLLRWYMNKSSISHTPYAARAIKIDDGTTRIVFMHRQILALPRARTPEVDHLDRNGLNNRRGNLRVVTHAQNLQNRRAQSGTSRFRNVTWNKNHQRWHVALRLDGRNRHIGFFSDEEEANQAAIEARRQLFPFSTDALTATNYALGGTK